MTEPIENLKILRALNGVKDLMKYEGVDEFSKYKTFISTALELDRYIISVKNNIDEILKDRKIDMKDIPRLILLTMQIKNILYTSLKLKKQISLDQAKYLVYATIYYFLDDDLVSNFQTLFVELWSLVEFDPTSLSTVCCC